MPNWFAFPLFVNKSFIVSNHTDFFEILPKPSDRSAPAENGALPLGPDL